MTPFLNREVGFCVHIVAFGKSGFWKEDRGCPAVRQVTPETVSREKVLNNQNQKGK
jgi:hypothetical protein